MKEEFYLIYFVLVGPGSSKWHRSVWPKSPMLRASQLDILGAINYDSPNLPIAEKSKSVGLSTLDEIANYFHYQD